MSANKVTVLPENPSEDLLLQKKRLPLDAQRILNIIESCISQVEIAASLPGILQVYKISGAVDKDLSTAIQAHQILDERVEKLKGLIQEPDGKLEGEDEEARRRKVAQLGRDIKNSVRDVLRGFKGHPNAFFPLRTEQALEVGESEYMLIKVLKMFHSHMVEKFLTSQERNLSKEPSSFPDKHLECLISEEEQVAVTLKKLDNQISELDDEIKNMQSYSKKDVMPEIDALFLPHKRRQQNKRPGKLQQDIDQTAIQLNSLRLEKGETVRMLREKNEMLEMETENLLLNFDDKMKEIQAKLEMNEIAYEKEVEELRKLQEPFSALEVEFNQIQEKRRLAEEKRMQEMKDLELKTKAAITVQAWWRGYSTRKALKNKGKSKKTKKGKSKKSR
ncbi:dynein regulatory complex protein 10 [Xenentodon cancila]